MKTCLAVVAVYNSSTIANAPPFMRPYLMGAKRICGELISDDKEFCDSFLHVRDLDYNSVLNYDPKCIAVTQREIHGVIGMMHVTNCKCGK